MKYRFAIDVNAFKNYLTRIIFNKHINKFNIQIIFNK